MYFPGSSSSLRHTQDVYGRGMTQREKPRVFTDSHLYAQRQIAQTIALGNKTARGR